MKKGLNLLALGMISIIALMLLFTAFGFRINLTDSIPEGLYRITHGGNLKNAYVIFCPDDRVAFRQALQRNYIDYGLYCDGYGYVMKKVVATQGDEVSITEEGVFVNQTIIPFSKPKRIDGMNRTLPRWYALNYRLKADELLTMTNQSEWSFDSRYYGPIHLNQIRGILLPIWVKTT